MTFYINRTCADEPSLNYQKTVDLKEAIEIFPFLKPVFTRTDFNLMILSYDTDKYQIVKLR